MHKRVAINVLRSEFRDFVAITSTNSNIDPSVQDRLDAFLKRAYAIKDQFKNTEDATEEKNNDNDDEQTLLLLNIELENASIRQKLDALENDIERTDNDQETHNYFLVQLTHFGSKIEDLLKETQALPATDEQRTILLTLDGTWDLWELLLNTLNTPVTDISRNDSDDDATQRVNLTHFYHSPLSSRAHTVTPSDYLNNNRRSRSSEIKDTDSQSTEIYGDDDNATSASHSPTGTYPIGERTHTSHPHYWKQSITLSGSNYCSSNATRVNSNTHNNIGAKYSHK